ncbi:MAG: hypothetical protein LAT75_08960 [Candidatus Cyclonatronum sp.]|uniref:hypothetical protein n=1 Tax=Cyclonatronum sp. TaxID=3024185 RepID=UPI0025BBF2A2|nr:hypothetical protein [Cyclonatronum sp.]MCH8486984.1 hypothetical protein [Cyclonatronum sp.]
MNDADDFDCIFLSVHDGSLPCPQPNLSSLVQLIAGHKFYTSDHPGPHAPEDRLTDVQFLF